MFSEDAFKGALSRQKLKKPAPAFVQGNRSHRVRVITEPELNAMTTQWFVEFEKKISFYEKLGYDLSWFSLWLKKWWWAWFEYDMELVGELCMHDIVYKDPVSFGRPLIGLKEFIAYNDAFFDAIPDWRYDPLPNQFYFDVSPGGEVRFAVRYIGTGHWDGPLKVYPFDKKSLAIAGTGAFMQCSAVDRYHFNSDRKMCEGETLWDAFDALQMSGLLPNDTSPAFRALTGAARIPAAFKRARAQRAP